MKHKEGSTHSAVVFGLESKADVEKFVPKKDYLLKRVIVGLIKNNPNIFLHYRIQGVQQSKCDLLIIKDPCIYNLGNGEQVDFRYGYNVTYTRGKAYKVVLFKKGRRTKTEATILAQFTETQELDLIDFLNLFLYKKNDTKTLPKNRSVHNPKI